MPDRGSWSGARANIVLILTDDQRWDTLDSMPYLARIAREGIRFDSAMVTTPLCNPTRASILAGGFYAAQTAILTNRGSNADVARFRHGASIAVALQQSGYTTGFVGKYLNNFPSRSAIMLRSRGVHLGPDESYVPPGWSTFSSTTTVDRSENPWHRFRLSHGSSDAAWAVGSLEWMRGHIEKRQRGMAVDFLENLSGRQPFFLMVSTHAPHTPAIPEARDVDLFSDSVYRDRSYGEADLSDKPERLARAAGEWPAEREAQDEFRRNQLRTLRSVDRLVRAVVRQLTESGRVDNTLLLFASDNGMMWGEHRNFGKDLAYEESIRVPLVAWQPGMVAARIPHLTAVNLDLPATILDVAGLDTTDPTVTSGTSLAPFLDGNTPSAWRSELILESYSDPAWLAVRRLVVDGNDTIVESRKYVEYYSGDNELYDLGDDSLELESKHRDPAEASIRGALASSLPALRGPLIVRPRVAPRGRVGVAWRLTPESCCALRPLTWDIRSGQLPPGVELNADTGQIAGTPTQAGDYEFALRVRSAGNVAPGRPGFFVRDYTAVVAPATRARE